MTLPEPSSRPLRSFLRRLHRRAFDLGLVPLYVPVSVTRTPSDPVKAALIRKLDDTYVSVITFRTHRAAEAFLRSHSSLSSNFRVRRIMRSDWPQFLESLGMWRSNCKLGLI
jgi:hypothetical protein